MRKNTLKSRDNIKEKYIFKDIKILFNLLKIFNPSGAEKNIGNSIKNFLKNNNIKFNVDSIGNIYNFNYKNAPFLSAHLDSVQTKKDKNVINTLSIINKEIIRSIPNGIIGADDIVGIFIILFLLKNNHNLKFNWILTVSEEVGGIGSDYFIEKNSNLIKDSLYGIVIDRKGSGDIICYDNYYGSKEFSTDLLKIGKKFGYKHNTGTYSDADNWSEYISCANISCGYYNAHTEQEYIVINEVYNTINFVTSIITNINKKYEHSKINPTYFENYILYDICNMCGKTINLEHDKLMYVSSLDKNICKDCAYDIVNEIQDLIFDYDIY